MLDIYLTDLNQRIQFKDYPAEHPVKFVLNFKKIFPSVMELLLPVLPDDEDLEHMTWESTQADFDIFKQLLSEWACIELRLHAMAHYKNKAFADQLVKKAQAKRKALKQQHSNLNQVSLDYVFMHEVHAQLDAELIDLGEKFYLPVLRQNWRGLVDSSVLILKS
ncbi:hypothetical protein [Acinetobacter larvae]|uniref:Uncharacterized protein n=1 Tax=Acinetobacter larvae TaxID=1789224 RepID=A0A1B2M0H7_9GAMM|nr:hypothetical protein [Acinetobacter larvae]AOA58669.1 hypothetical protein BFG52_10095 [Acinetobacter larvae]